MARFSIVNLLSEISSMSSFSFWSPPLKTSSLGSASPLVSENPHSTKFTVVVRRRLDVSPIAWEDLTMLSAFSFAIPLRIVRVGAAASIKYLRNAQKKSEGGSYKKYE